VKSGQSQGASGFKIPQNPKSENPESEVRSLKSQVPSPKSTDRSSLIRAGLTLPGPTLVAPAAPYGKRWFHTGRRGDVERVGPAAAGLAAPQTDQYIPAASAGAAGQEHPDREGDGKLRIHIYDEDIRKVLDLLTSRALTSWPARASRASLRHLERRGHPGRAQCHSEIGGYVAHREGNFIFVGTPETSTISSRRWTASARDYPRNYVTSAELKALVTPLLTKDRTLSVSTPAEAGIA